MGRIVTDTAHCAGLAIRSPILVPTLLRGNAYPAAGSDKTQIALRVDNATLAAFRATGQGWQLRMNQALELHSAARHLTQ